MMSRVQWARWLRNNKWFLLVIGVLAILALYERSTNPDNRKTELFFQEDPPGFNRLQREPANVGPGLAPAVLKTMPLVDNNNKEMPLKPKYNPQAIEQKEEVFNLKNTNNVAMSREAIYKKHLPSKPKYTDNMVDMSREAIHKKEITLKPKYTDLSPLRNVRLTKKIGHSDKIAQSSYKAIKRRFLARNSLISCNRWHHLYTTLPAILIKNNYFTICRIRKVASTFFNHYNKALHKSDHHTNINGQPPRHILVVRDPYERFMSGFIDRVVSNPVELVYFTPSDVLDFWPNATRLQAEARCNNVVTFPQFVKFFIYYQQNGYLIESHFRPMSHMCDPCQLKFDFIAHLETFDEDMSYILRSMHLGEFNFSGYSNLDTVFERATKFKEKQLTNEGRRCESMCSSYRHLWWSYQAQGMIPRHVPLPLKGRKCESLSPSTFTRMVEDMTRGYKGRFDKALQKREMMVELFLQVPIQDRLKLRDLLSRDFLLFGYDSVPKDLFPELNTG